MLVLNGDQVSSLLSPQDTLQVVSQAFIALTRGQALQPLRANLAVAGSGSLLVMPAYLAEGGELAVKLVSYFPDNGARGLPVVQGVVVLFDAVTGTALAAMDAARLTGLRTAAASAAATRALAREDADELALLGAGVQARTHLAAMLAVRPIKRVRVAARRLESARRFCASAEVPPGVSLEAVASAEEAVRGAGIVCAVSAATEPIVRWEWVEPGTHINGVGSHTAASREIDSETMARSRVVVDSRESALAEAGDCVIPIKEGRFGPEHVSDELGEVLGGTRPGRSDRAQVTVFKSCGLAVQDVAAAALAYRRARERGVGTEVAL